MSNRTDPMALSVHGTNPQNLVEKILRMKIYANSFWKEKCFGLTAATLVDRAMELDMYGGTYGGNKKPSKFMCLILKMLQIQPEKDIVVEFIKNEEFRYVRVLGAFYLRLVGRPIDVYKYIEPLLNDFRRIRFKTDKGYRITHVDEFADELLHSLTSCDITLPHLPKRYIMEITQDLEPYVSMLDDEDLPDFNQEEKEKEEEKNKEKKQRDKETDRRDNRDKERDRDRRDRRDDDRDRRDDDRDRERDRDRRDRDREDRDRGRDREDRDRDRDRRDRDRDNDRDRRDRDRDNDRDRDRDRDRRDRDRDRDADRDKDRGRDRRRDDDDEERRRKRDREEERERKDDLPKDSSSRDKEKERERDRARIARMERSSGSSTNKKKESKAAVGGGGGGAVESMSVEETNKLRAQLGLPLLK